MIRRVRGVNLPPEVKSRTAHDREINGSAVRAAPSHRTEKLPPRSLSRRNAITAGESDRAIQNLPIVAVHGYQGATVCRSPMTA